MIRIHALLALLVIGGCSELSSIEPDVCGNGVVEANEDCDSFLGHCFECSLVCTTDAECTDLAGPGFVCGFDALCHAPSGGFRQVSQVAVDVDSYRIARTTTGPFGDVIAQSSSSVSVLYGDSVGSLSTSATVQSPIAQGPVTFAKLDGDQIPDLLVPTIDGIAAFTFGYGVPTPYTFPNLVAEIAGGEPLTTFNIGAQYLGGVAKLPGNAHELVILEVGPGGERVVGRTDLCDVQPNETFAESRSDVHVMPGVQTHAVFMTVLSSGRACAIAIDQKVVTNPSDPFHLTDVTPAMPAMVPSLDPTERGILVRFAASRCPMLVAQGAGGGLLEFPGKDLATEIRPCVFEQGRSLPRRDLNGVPKFSGAPLGFLPLGTVAVPRIAIVLTDGVYLYEPAGFLRQFYASDRLLAGVETVDLDGDANLDLVARGVGSEDLDLLYQIALPPPMFGVLRVRFDTDGDVSRLLPGDYDGNLRSDIAYVERIEGRDRLMIAYGTSDRPLAGQAVGTFEGVFSMIRIDFPDSTDPFGIVADLGVLYGFGAKKQIALLHGSPQRTMQAFFDPRISLIGPGVPSNATLVEIGGVIPGHFNGGLGGHDILGLASSSVTSSVYVTPAAPDGELSSAARCGVTATLVRCGDRTDQTALCTDAASYLPWAMSATHDVVIGIDGRGTAMTFDPVQAGDCSAPTSMTAITWTDQIALPAGSSPNARRVRSIAKVSAESSELLISFAPRREGTPSDAAIRVCPVVGGAGQACEDPADLISGRVGFAVVCSDLAAGRATQVSRFGTPPPPVPDLFAVCGVPGEDRSVYRISRFADRTQVDVLFGIGKGDEIEVGDINGDSVDDIVVLERGGTKSLLRVYTQCTSRNATDCAQLPGEDGAP